MKRTQKMVLTALFAAMITVMTAYICHIPTGINEGYIHFGDALIYMAACFLPMPYAIAAGAIGGGLADLLTAPVWAVATMIIKALICLPFTSKGPKILCGRNVAAVCISGLISAVGYAIAEGIMFGTWVTSIAGFSGSAIQSGGSAVLFILLGLALDKIGLKRKVKNL